MDISFISSLAVSEATRRSISRSQEALVQAQQSLATGRKADIGLALGADTGRLVSLRTDIDQLDTIIGSNNLSLGRLEANPDCPGDRCEHRSGLLQHTTGG